MALVIDPRTHEVIHRTSTLPHTRETPSLRSALEALQKVQVYMEVSDPPREVRSAVSVLEQFVKTR